MVIVLIGRDNLNALPRTLMRRLRREDRA